MVAESKLIKTFLKQDFRGITRRDEFTIVITGFHKLKVKLALELICQDYPVVYLVDQIRNIVVQGVSKICDSRLPDT